MMFYFVADVYISFQISSRTLEHAKDCPSASYTIGSHDSACFCDMTKIQNHMLVLYQKLLIKRNTLKKLDYVGWWMVSWCNEINNFKPQIQVYDIILVDYCDICHFQAGCSACKRIVQEMSGLFIYLFRQRVVSPAIPSWKGQHEAPY